jgi:hypothetical protein
MWRTGTFILGLQVAAALPVAAANYICIADETVGFSYNKATNKWQSVNLYIGAEKYTLTTEDGKRVWKKLGDPLPMRRCQETDTYVICDIMIMRVSLNKSNLRYQIIYDFGYVEGNDSPDDTPYIQIGRCSSM